MLKFVVHKLGRKNEKRLLANPGRGCFAEDIIILLPGKLALPQRIKKS
jgi:hypothetical protein